MIYVCFSMYSVSIGSRLMFFSLFVVVNITGNQHESDCKTFLNRIRRNLIKIKFSDKMLLSYRSKANRMDSLKWNAIKFVWICFGLMRFSRLIIWDLHGTVLPFSQIYICLRPFTYLTVVHLITVFLQSNQLNFPTKTKTHLKLVSDWHLIKITANE